MKLSSPLGECRLAGASPRAASVGLPGLAGFLLCPEPLMNIWWIRSARCLVIFCSLLYLRRACRVAAGSCSGESHQRITRGTSCCRAEGRSWPLGRFETHLLAPHHTHGGERTQTHPDPPSTPSQALPGCSRPQNSGGRDLKAPPWKLQEPQRFSCGVKSWVVGRIGPDTPQEGWWALGSHHPCSPESRAQTGMGSVGRRCSALPRAQTFPLRVSNLASETGNHPSFKHPRSTCTQQRRGKRRSPGDRRSDASAAGSTGMEPHGAGSPRQEQSPALLCRPLQPLQTPQGEGEIAPHPCCRGRAPAAPSSPRLLPPKRPPKPHVLHGCTKPKALLVETRRAPSQLRFGPVCRGIAAIFAAAAAGEHHAQHAEKHLSSVSAEPTWTQRIFYLHGAKNPHRGLNMPTWPKTKVLDPKAIPLVPTDGAQPFRVCHRSVRTQGTGDESSVTAPAHVSPGLVAPEGCLPPPPTCLSALQTPVGWPRGEVG